MIAHFARRDYQVESTTLGPRWRPIGTDEWLPVHHHAEEQVNRVLQAGASEVWCLRAKDVRAARGRRGWTIGNLSLLSGVTEADIQAIETHRIVPTRDTLDRLARALHA